ncbi:hypothetical protein [Persephonella sp.]|uniref:hypothetical protein n=1 Tax=Persephonella sp. TaxID=2060922 RepID=UPI0025D3308F|nr:hypothetical protein [Persephonella sp.]
MDILKKIGSKELTALVSPLIAGVFIFILLDGFLRQKIIEHWGSYLNYYPEIIDIEFTEKKEKSVDIEFLQTVLNIKPYTVKTANKIKTPEQPPPFYKISFIYIGKSRYTIINGKLYTEGDKVSPEERIVRISKEGVLLKGKWGERWIKFYDY